MANNLFNKCCEEDSYIPAKPCTDNIPDALSTTNYHLILNSYTAPVNYMEEEIAVEFTCCSGSQNIIINHFKKISSPYNNTYITINNTEVSGNLYTVDVSISWDNTESVSETPIVYELSLNICGKEVKKLYNFYIEGECVQKTIKPVNITEIDNTVGGDIDFEYLLAFATGASGCQPCCSGAQLTLSDVRYQLTSVDGSGGNFDSGLINVTPTSATASVTSYLALTYNVVFTIAYDEINTTTIFPTNEEFLTLTITYTYCNLYTETVEYTVSNPYYSV